MVRWQKQDGCRALTWREL